MSLDVFLLLLLVLALNNRAVNVGISVKATNKDIVIAKAAVSPKLLKNFPTVPDIKPTGQPLFTVPAQASLMLVNALTLSELKAVLAHEFGHFAQRSMALGNWVYIAQQIAAHIIARRDALDNFLPGYAILFMYEQTGLEKYKIASKKI